MSIAAGRSRPAQVAQAERRVSDNINLPIFAIIAAVVPGPRHEARARDWDRQIRLSSPSMSMEQAKGEKPLAAMAPSLWIGVVIAQTWSTTVVTCG